MSELEVAAGFAPVLPCRFRLAPQCQVLARLSGPRSAAQWSLGPSHLRPETNSPGMCSLRPCAHQKSAGGLAHERELTLAGKSVRCRRSRCDRHLRAVQHDLCDIPYKQIMHGGPSPLWPTSTCQRHLPFRKHREPSARPLEAVTDMLPLHCQTGRLNFAFKSTMAANVPKPPYSMHSAHTTRSGGQWHDRKPGGAQCTARRRQRHKTYHLPATCSQCKPRASRIRGDTWPHL